MKKNILIIEDDEFFGSLISKKLSDDGFEISLSPDGERGFDSAVKEKPDLILLDLLLPGIDGFEVLKKIKENDDIKSTPVIILSNLGQPEEIDKGLSLGATDFLIKAQITPEEVADKIEKVFGKK